MGEYYYKFKDEDLTIDEALGYPRAYAKICRENHAYGPYSHGPPSTFIPYGFKEAECMRFKEMESMFPLIDPKARPTCKARNFLHLLWKQLNHLGNAGFDPKVIRVDPYGNVLYYHADSASPLAWQIDHWFPCSRGGLTVPSNLRILQWQVHKKKHNKLEFLLPWWDLQLGVSVNQFLSIFAASNSDFRRRAFCFLFKEGECEELNECQTVESHSFPRHFIEAKEQFGLAPAAIVRSGGEPFDPSSALRSLDYNRQSRPQSPASAGRMIKAGALKENEVPDFVTNPYQAIVMARDSLRKREEAQKMQSEIKRLDEEVGDMRTRNNEENCTIQELEIELIKRRRRAEKWRKLADTQCSYRTVLEKMIRDALHQSVVYKEQVRLNQAATNALTARLEAQKAICEASEKELHRKFKYRDELEQAVRYDLIKTRKRSRTDQELSSDGDNSVLCLMDARPVHKELRVFLEEEQKASEAESSQKFQKYGHMIEKQDLGKGEHGKELVQAVKEVDPRDQHRLAIEEKMLNLHRLSGAQDPEIEENEETTMERGKGNIEKWLQLLLENNAEQELESQIEEGDAEDVNTSESLLLWEQEQKPELEEKERKSNQQETPETEAVKAVTMDEINQKETTLHAEVTKAVTEAESLQNETLNAEVTKAVTKTSSAIGGSSGRRSFDFKEKREKNGKGKELKRSESARAFRRIPSSPSIILKKGVDCIRKKPMVMGDEEDDEDNSKGNNNFLKSIKTIRKSMKF